MRCNVDILKPIQIGITIWSPEGDLPPPQLDPALIEELGGDPKKSWPPFLPCSWVFNFQFSLSDDLHSQPSIEMLKEAGVQFERHEAHGVPLHDFGAALTSSGFVFNKDVNWLSFHSGYDFAYLIKLLSASPLPKTQEEFFSLVPIYFPKLWDVKTLWREIQRRKTCGRLGVDATHIVEAVGSKSGLQDLANELGCKRHGIQHTGGSDAWLTGTVFWAVRQKLFNNDIDPKLSDQIYGLHNVQAPANPQLRDEFLAATQGQTPSQVSQSYNPTTAAYAPSTPTNSHTAPASHTTPGHYLGSYYGK
ncbi:ribonuclease H-like protein [Piedraia hortae CBS 480.64]|uniref:poly(A)-specific ribonuclease n=1 Tax=Piedraia hortae CBS 480.64 TaxID=1314780 RepID=A0A6A7C3W2_9PEZI|nr:ribonuclease H-like protein [Piedraia hortae CBS 480.64]